LQKSLKCCIIFCYTIYIMKKISAALSTVILVIFVAAILVLSVRGLPGNPTQTELNTTYWKDNGPFELSPERGRYALIYSLVEDHSFQLPTDIAKFTSPDVGFLNGHYVTIFAPSISLLGIPGYVIGKHFDAAQFGTFLWIAIFALLNVLLIRAIAIRMGANSIAASLAGLIFLFATPAFAYAVTLYEHHVSTFLILLSFYLLIRFNTVWSLILIWILYGFAFTVDYPNLFMMFPIALAAFFKSATISQIREKVSIKISFPRILAVLAVIIPLILFLWINQQSYHNPFQLSGTVARVFGVRDNGTPILWQDVYKSTLAKTGQNANLPPPGSIFTFFKPRNMLNGLYILLISPDRGVVVYTPIMLLGVFGLYLAAKKKDKYLPITLSVIAVDLVLYAMWGDPYGGWAFGARYLIPAYAVLSIYLALLLTYLGKHRLFVLLFFVVLSYSIMVNSVGALTSNSNPPKVEADALSNQVHQRVEYTYIRNVNELNQNLIKSYVFESYAGNYLSAWQYYSYITIFILSIAAILIINLHIAIRKKHKEGGKHALES